MKQTPIKRQFINLRTCQVLLYSMDSTSVYGLELLVFEGTGGKALATDHRECTIQTKNHKPAAYTSVFIVQSPKSLYLTQS